MPSFPSSLPAIPLLAGYSEKNKSRVIRTSMDVGVDKTRPRYSKTITNFNYNLILTKDQVAILDDFIETDLSGGSLSFTFNHPRTGVSGSYRFLENPTYSAKGNDYYDVSIELELLP